jgi:hypothetical protein
MPSQNVFVQAQIGPGTYVSPAVTIPQGIAVHDIQLVSSDWPDPALLWSVDVEKSLDGGQTWQYWFGSSGDGQWCHDKLGNNIMPRFGVNLTGSEPGAMVRVAVSLNKKIKIGLRSVTT